MKWLANCGVGGNFAEFYADELNLISILYYTMKIKKKILNLFTKKISIFI